MSVSCPVACESIGVHRSFSYRSDCVAQGSSEVHAGVKQEKNDVPRMMYHVE
jgi:hypothetical protein